jgi:uncharacterized sulfatase
VQNKYQNTQMNKFKIVFKTILWIFISFTCSAQNRPNIVLIMADDLGGRDLSVYGNQFNESPNINKLASQGMLFSNAYAAPVCSPTRASIQSGQYPARVGVFDFIPGHWRPYEEVTVPHNKKQHLPNEIFTIGEAMQSAGYKTGYFGKWHLGRKLQYHPINRGYNQAYTYRGGGFYNPSFEPKYETTENKRLSEALTDMGLAFIEENKNNPFFLFISHYDVHVQLDADKDLIEKYKKKKKDPNYSCNAVYAAMIEHLDESVGAIMNHIDEMGLAENTVFIFYSDNGGVNNRYDNIPLLGGKSTNVYPEGHPLKYLATTNSPLRAGKGTLYEGGIRVPMIIKWPGKVRPGSTSEAIVSNVDFYPTFLDLAKSEQPKKQKLDGHSMLPPLTKNTFDIEREIFTHYPVYHHEQPMSAVRKGDWKVIENLVSGAFSLYNLKYDINEMVDLKFSHPEKFDQMKMVLKKWQKDTKAQNPMPNPEFNFNKRYEWGRNPYVGLD